MTENWSKQNVIYGRFESNFFRVNFDGRLQTTTKYSLLFTFFAHKSSETEWQFCYFTISQNSQIPNSFQLQHNIKAIFNNFLSAISIYS